MISYGNFVENRLIDLHYAIGFQVEQANVIFRRMLFMARLFVRNSCLQPERNG